MDLILCLQSDCYVKLSTEKYRGQKSHAPTQIVSVHDQKFKLYAGGAYADILIVDGNPLEDILLLVKPEKNLKVIMKDGKVYKNTLN